MTQISVCIITKDQQQKLHKCLQAIRTYPVQIVVMDTGSMDESVKEAKKITPYVYETQWQNDFSAAKNEVIQKAEHDMVMILDTDEYVERLDFENLLKLLDQHHEEVGRIRRVNKFKQDGKEFEYAEYINRIFDRRLYQYEGTIHEQVVRKDGKTYQTYETPIEILHDGYDLTKKEFQKKATRNITLLKKELEKRPEDPYLAYQLGKSFYVIESYEEAVNWFEIALGFEPDVALEYVEDLIETYGYGLLKIREVQKALSLQKYETVFQKSADFIFLVGLILMNNTKFKEAVEMFLRATKLPESRTKGTNSYMAYYNAGVIKECMGEKKEALCLYQKCDGYEEAKKGIARLLQ